MNMPIKCMCMNVCAIFYLCHQNALGPFLAVVEPVNFKETCQVKRAYNILLLVFSDMSFTSYSGCSSAYFLS